MRRLFPILATLTALPAGALADGVTAPYQMESLDGDDRAGVDIMLGRYELELFGEVDITTVSMDAFVQMHVAPNVIVFGRLPFQYAQSSVEGADDESGTSLGNITGGAMFVSRSGDTTVGGGGSLSLPTADDDGDGAGAALLHSLFRVSSYGLYLPNTWTIRLHGDVRVDRGKTFVQARGGLDYITIDEEDEDEDLKLLRIGVAGGAMINPTVAVIAELTTMSSILEDSDADDDEEWVHVLDLGVRARSGRTLFGARIYLPLDETFRDANMMGLGVDVSGTF